MIEDAEEIPTILVQPIGYGDAEQFLDGMDGDEVPPDWRGNLNIVYRFGPGYLNDPYSFV